MTKTTTSARRPPVDQPPTGIAVMSWQVWGEAGGEVREPHSQHRPQTHSPTP
jgi:hypothetical protein